MFFDSLSHFMQRGGRSEIKIPSRGGDSEFYDRFFGGSPTAAGMREPRRAAVRRVGAAANCRHCRAMSILKKHYFTSFQSSVRNGTAGMPKRFFRLQGMWLRNA